MGLAVHSSSSIVLVQASRSQLSAHTDTPTLHLVVGLDKLVENEHDQKGADKGVDTLSHPAPT